MNFPKISAFSTALYSTFWFLESWRLLLDCGDGAATFLQQKGRKVKYIFLSHADRDHLTGLFRFLEVNAPSKGSPPIQIYYPGDCGSFPAMEAFLAKFDPHVAGSSEWHPLKDGDVIPFKSGFEMEVYPNRHIPRGTDGDGINKSLSVSIYQTANKLRPEYTHLSGPEIGEMRQAGKDLFEKKRVNRLTYSADTPLEAPDYWRSPEILIHEATFLSREDAASRKQELRHAALPDVIEMAAEMTGLRALAVGHFSTRYSEAKILETLETEVARVGLTIPVIPVLPGEFKVNMFEGLMSLLEPAEID